MGARSVSPMPNRLATRLSIIVLVVSVCLLTTQSIGHWHNNPIDEQHCQVCHVGQSAVPQPVSQAEIQALVPLARFVCVAQLSFDLGLVPAKSIPRAPPA